MKKLPISICIISGAEAHRIGRTLASVANWSSEIIVVLNHDVCDGTAEIAEKYGAKVFREPWKGFIGQKNSAADKATQRWLLNVDADEVVTPELAEAIGRVVADATATPVAYEFPRCTFYCGRWIRHGDWYPDRVLRLCKRGSARWEGVEPHACLKVLGGIGRLRPDLLHYSFENIDVQIGKIIPYSRSFVEHSRREGRKAGVFDLLVRPCWRFMRAYIFKLGFLDGWPGYYIAWLNAFATLTRYAKLREVEQPHSREP